MKSLHQSFGLFYWTFLRYRAMIPVLVLVQILFSAALLWGLPVLTGTPLATEMSEIFVYLSAIWTLSSIIIGLTIAPQLLSESKLDGYISYIKTLPVSRLLIYSSELMVWILIAVPGFFFSYAICCLRFSLLLPVNVIVSATLLLSLLTFFSIGITIALSAPLPVVQVLSQILSLIGFLFTPILYPAHRLPNWLLNIHSVLPFYAPHAIFTHAVTEEFSFADMVQPIIVLVLWFLFFSGIPILILKRRQ